VKIDINLIKFYIRMKHFDINCKFEKYSKKKIFKGDVSNLSKLFCLATPEYCKIFKLLNGDINKFINYIACKTGTELENFTTLRVKNKLIGFYSGYPSKEITQRQLKTSLIMRNLLKKKKKILFTKKIQLNLSSLPSVTNKSFYISRNSILKGHQKLGYGKILLEKVFEENDQFKSLSLHVNKKNIKAQNFYNTYGFKKISSKKKYILYMKIL